MKIKITKVLCALLILATSTTTLALPASDALETLDALKDHSALKIEASGIQEPLCLESSDLNADNTDQNLLAQRCCKVCKKGKACGDSCIAKSKQCHKGAGCKLRKFSGGCDIEEALS